jgi:hypothetical protein
MPDFYEVLSGAGQPGLDDTTGPATTAGNSPETNDLAELRWRLAASRSEHDKEASAIHPHLLRECGPCGTHFDCTCLSIQNVRLPSLA